MIGAMCRLKMFPRLSLERGAYALLICLEMIVADPLWAQNAPSDIKLVLLESRDGYRMFLSEGEALKFSDILNRITPRNENTPSKAQPELICFFFWTYDSKSNNLVRHAISFNDQGRSVNWSIDPDVSDMIRSLSHQVELRKQ